MGHLGVERVFDLAKSRFDWPNVKENITHYVTKVCRCLKQKPPAMKQREPLQPIITTAPFEDDRLETVFLPESELTETDQPVEQEPLPQIDQEPIPTLRRSMRQRGSFSRFSDYIMD